MVTGLEPVSLKGRRNDHPFSLRRMIRSVHPQAKECAASPSVFCHGRAEPGIAGSVGAMLQRRGFAERGFSTCLHGGVGQAFRRGSSFTATVHPSQRGSPFFSRMPLATEHALPPSAACRRPLHEANVRPDPNFGFWTSVLVTEGAHESDHRIDGVSGQSVPSTVGFLETNRVHPAAALQNDFAQVGVGFRLHVG